ncbi:MAG: phage major capsid protein [Clostridia bacterium]|nr:phage major capsid protein [Clostridia bacterium]
MKDYLTKLIARKNKELADLKKRNDESEDINEVKTIGSQIEGVNAELAEAQAQLDKIEAEENKEENKEEERSAFNPNAALNVASAKMNEKRSEDTDELASMEYRKAFMNYVQRGIKSDVLKFEQRNGDESGVASDLGVLLPKTVVQEIITGVEKVYGQLYSRVRKLNIKGGVRFPIGSFSATFKRIAENAKSDRQKAGEVDEYVQFTYNIGEIRIATSLLQSVLSVPAFEKEIAKVIIEAYVQAMDKEIMLGDSTDGEMEGIITEAEKVSSRIDASHIIEFTEAEMADWKSWQKKLFKAIPLSMRALNPEFVMTANTYEANIKTLADNNDRPVYNETYNPVDGTEISKFKGKNVVFVEEDVLDNFDDDDAEYFGMYWVPEKAYAINTNMEFTMRRYFDEELNQYVDKALVINDGKVLDPKYIYLLKKGE